MTVKEDNVWRRIFHSKCSDFTQKWDTATAKALTAVILI